MSTNSNNVIPVLLIAQWLIVDFYNVTQSGHGCRIIKPIPLLLDLGIVAWGYLIVVYCCLIVSASLDPSMTILYIFDYGVLCIVVPSDLGSFIVVYCYIIRSGHGPLIMITVFVPVSLDLGIVAQ